MRTRALGWFTAMTLSLAAPLAFGQADPSADPNQVRAMAMAKKMDMNNDGMVSKKEFMAAMEAKWNAMDKQKKGMVTVEQAAKMLFVDVGAP